MIYITRKMHFAAAHRLFNPEFSDDKNWEVYGLCNNPNGHGHNYDLEVTVAGEPDNDTGMVLDLKELKTIIQEEVIDLLDHKHLNFDVPGLRKQITTAENIAVFIWDNLVDKLPSGQLYEIKLYESERNFVVYRG